MNNAARTSFSPRVALCTYRDHVKGGLNLFYRVRTFTAERDFKGQFFGAHSVAIRRKGRLRAVGADHLRNEFVVRDSREDNREFGFG